MNTPLKGLLEAIYSERDRAGNCYWAMRYTDFATGRTVVGTVSGGESNIYGVLLHWNVPKDWDRSVTFRVSSMKIREFNRAFKGVPHAGSAPEDLARFLKDALLSQPAQS